MKPTNSILTAALLAATRHHALPTENTRGHLLCAGGNGRRDGE